MPSADSLLAFTALSFGLVVIPGPSVLFVVSRGVALGRRAALLTVVGNATGAYVQVVFVALGLGVIVQRSMMVPGASPPAPPGSGSPERPGDSSASAASVAWSWSASACDWP